MLPGPVHVFGVESRGMVRQVWPAVWDVCADDRVRIVDTSDGTVLEKGGAAGLPGVVGGWAVAGQLG